MAFTPEQKAVLIRYFEELGMTSTHRRNTDLMQRCADEVGTTIERIKVPQQQQKKKPRMSTLICCMSVLFTSIELDRF